MLTVSLVTYKHDLADVAPVIEGVLASCCEKFTIVDNSNMAEFAGELANFNDARLHYTAAENRGFGAGHNLAIRDALTSGSRFHAIVNPDIRFAPGTLEKIVAFMRENPDIGVVMPKTLNPDGSMQYNCKLVPAPLDLIFKRFLPPALKCGRMRKFMMQDFDHEQIMDVPYLCGCFMVFRREALEKAGLFDERFFMYPEDIDITRRIYSAGFRTVYYPEAEVIHAHEQASRKNLRMLKIHAFNMISYFNKWGWLFDRERRRINREILERLTAAENVRSE